MTARKRAGIPAVGIFGVLLSACSGTPPTNIGVQSNGELKPCSSKPNCVSSMATDDKHKIAPLNAGQDQWERLPGVLESMPRITIVQQDGNYLYAEASTRLMGFVDDLEFLYKPDEAVIHVRSASRLGYSDLGANRKRMESIREKL